MPEWDELFKEKQYRWQEPDETVEALAHEFRQQPGQSEGHSVRGRILDLGFGAGRHVVYLAREGFEVSGTDVSPRGLELAQEWLCREGLQADLRLSDMTVIPYPENTFDAVISTFVIHHNTLDNIQRCIGEIHRVLKLGGKALLIVQSKRGYRYNTGQEIEPDTFIPETGDDAGIPHHFFDPAGLRELLSAFASIGITAREGYSIEGYRHAHWVVVVQK